MTAFTFLIVAISLLALLSGLGFVGCVLDTSGYGYDPDNPEKPTQYTDYSKDVTNDPSVVAYWPLNEPSPADASGKIACHDAVGSNDGEYKHKGNDANFFPIPGFNINPATDSAAATGFLGLGAVSLVAGDAKNGDPNDLQTGMQTDGAFVTVPFSGVVNPPKFTVEAWVRPEWNEDQLAYRAIVDSRDNVGGQIHGFVLWSNENHHWEAAMADVNNNFLFATDPDTVLLGQPAYLAFTFDGVNAALFVNGVKKSAPMALGAAYSPNTTETLVIGGGEPWLPDRVGGVGDQFFPIFPFSGTIQDVAIYNDVLSDDTIKTRFEHGSGKTESAP